MSGHVIILNTLAEVRVDEPDFHYFNQWKWQANTPERPYAQRCATIKGKQHKLYLHRVIMNCPPGLVVNHIDGDIHNCTRANLEITTSHRNSSVLRVNNRSRSGFAGVETRHMRMGTRYRVKATVHGRRFTVGTYDSPEEAARAYDVVMVTAYQHNAPTNFPLEDYADLLIDRDSFIPEPTEEQDIPF